MYDGSAVTTIGGITSGSTLHPVQAAFICWDAFQGGYCTPGQICSAVALLDEVAHGVASYVTPDVRARGPIILTNEEIRERMSGNFCRCGAYQNIVAAIREAQNEKTPKEETASSSLFLSSTPRPVDALLFLLQALNKILIFCPLVTYKTGLLAALLKIGYQRVGESSIRPRNDFPSTQGGVMEGDAPGDDLFSTSWLCMRGRGDDEADESLLHLVGNIGGIGVLVPD